MRVLTLVVFVATLAACGSSSTHTANAPVTTTTTVAGRAQIVSFVVPASVKCGAAPSTTVRISYSVTGAQQQTVAVDGRMVPGTEASIATLTAPIHCDPLEHDVALTATDAHGGVTSQVKHLTTQLP